MELPFWPKNFGKFSSSNFGHSFHSKISDIKSIQVQNFKL
jgi:hypothetical protein